MKNPISVSNLKKSVSAVLNRIGGDPVALRELRSVAQNLRHGVRVGGDATPATPASPTPPAPAVAPPAPRSPQSASQVPSIAQRVRVAIGAFQGGNELVQQVSILERELAQVQSEVETLRSLLQAEQTIRLRAEDALRTAAAQQRDAIDLVSSFGFESSKLPRPFEEQPPEAEHAANSQAANAAAVKRIFPNGIPC